MENKEKVLERINTELAKIDNKEIQILFFVIDTKGNPSGSLEYIYKLAYTAKKNGYNVSMLYQANKDEDFVGVSEWLGEEYANLPHFNVSEGELNVSPSDILFIPEIFANVMVQTKKLPCKKIAILQNYDYMVEQMPFSVQWGDLNVLDCITNTEVNKNLLNEVFPYVKTTVIEPSIDEIFGYTSEPKKMIINVVSKNQSDINRVIKPFYWKYPYYKWVSFRDLRGLSKEEFATALRESEITVWIDDDSSFGYTALEAMKSGNIVIAKTTTNDMPWAKTDDEYNDSCLWFDKFDESHKIIASVVRAVITEKVPEKITKDSEDVFKKYSNSDNTEKTFIEYLQNVINNRRNEISKLIEDVQQ